MLRTAEIDCLIALLDLEQYTVVTGDLKLFQGERKFFGKDSLQEKPKLFKGRHREVLG